MSVSLMNLEEIISSAKNKTYTKKIACVCALSLVVCMSVIAIAQKFEVAPALQALMAIVVCSSLLGVFIAFTKWGDQCGFEQFASKNKIPQMTVGQFKKLYKTYGGAPVSHKRLNEKILMEQIMVDIALHFKNQGTFVEPLTDFVEKGIKHKTTNVYSFVAMAESVSLDDRVNVYILDTFFSADFLDEVPLKSIKFKADRVNFAVIGPI